MFGSTTNQLEIANRPLAVVLTLCAQVPMPRRSDFSLTPTELLPKMFTSERRLFILMAKTQFGCAPLFCGAAKPHIRGPRQYWDLVI